MSIVRRVARLFCRSKLDQEIEAELQSHIEMRIADNMERGMSRAEARRNALIRFGNPHLMKERVAAVDAEMVLDSLWRDLHYSVRQLLRSPAFTLTATVTLALGIGANVVAFGVLNSLVLKPLDVPQPARLYSVVHQAHGYDNQSYPDYVDFRNRNSTFSDMLAYRMMEAGLSVGNAAYKCWYDKVSGNYFDMLGAQPEVGRLFHSSDEHGANSAPYIVLSDSFWRANLHADPLVVGTIVQLNKHPFTVIGVAPAAFHGTDVFIWPDFWTPIVNGQDYSDTNFLTNRGMHNLFVLGRLKPGVTPQQATDNLIAIARDLARRYPEDDGLNARLTKPGLFGDSLGEPMRAFLAAIMLLAILVLLAACTNLASIFAARTADRGKELAIRLAIGSSRWHVVRQLLSEAMLTGLMGGALGTLLSATLLRMLARWQPFPEFPIRVAVSPDVRVYFVALVLSMGSGLLFGLLPLRQVLTANAAQVIKNTAGSVPVFRRFTLRDLLLGIQISLCTLLVTSSFVALRGMQRSLRAPLGFQPQGVTLAETDMHMGGHSDRLSLPLQKRMLEEAARIPGVIAVGYVNETPLGTGPSSSMVFRQGTTDFRTSTSAFGAKYFSISPGYLYAAGTHLLAGRDFSWHDDEHVPKVALVNQTFARRLFGDAPAVGQHFMMFDKNSYEIVGVIEDGKYDSLTESKWPAMFFPVAQNPDTDTTLVVRSELPTSEIAPVLLRKLADIDPSLPFTIHSWPQALALVLFPARVATASLGLMGALAAMLAITGIFGMATYSVSKRIKELGIRIALGARPVQLMRSALGRPVVILLCGSAAGLLLGVVASRLLAQIVYEATPRDPLVLGGVVATMTFLGLVATLIPAQHALNVDPAGLLREQ